MKMLMVKGCDDDRGRGVWCCRGRWCGLRLSCGGVFGRVGCRRL